MAKTEYIIVGDSDKYNGCLIRVCGASKERANEVLNRILTNPNDEDKAVTKSLRNLRIEEVLKEDCWWNENYD